ncbi:MAG: mechanosensitive ion channel family protein [Leptospirales bacterium]|nr:mechanosensitive ion channel family protein [Leptospirales bacterium]
MDEIINFWIYSVNWREKFIITGDVLIRLLFILAISFAFGKIISWIVLKITKRYVNNSKHLFIKSLIEQHVNNRFVIMFPLIILYVLSNFSFSNTPGFEDILLKIIFSILIGLGIYTFNAFLNAIDNYYQEFEVSKINPIKGYFQMVKIFVAMVGIVVIISNLFDKPPLGLLSGLGAMTALVILVFRDWILGLIASIQINANHLLVIGDIIEIEKDGIHGEVIDISLSTVKVKNWDNTISMIPAYTIISDTFKNWHGIKQSGGRRLRRIINIDVNSINLPDDKLLKRIQKLKLLKDQINMKELSVSIKKNRDERINRNELTNIGLFRKYTERYLKEHPGINQEKNIIVRLLEPSGNGIPLQIYVFTTLVELVEYELAVAEIMEHLISVAPEFGLKLFQNPTGGDFAKSMRPHG